MQVRIIGGQFGGGAELGHLVAATRAPSQAPLPFWREALRE